MRIADPPPREALDVSHLPDSGFGPRVPIWWGTLGYMVLEGLVFIVLIVSWAYLRKNFEAYPPPGTPHPDLLLPTVNLMVILASTYAAHRISKSSKALDAGATSTWQFVSVAFGIVFLTLRAFEFDAVHVRWDTNAYGSVVWAILVAHTAHIAAATIEDLVLGVTLRRGPVLQRHFTDASEGAFYWYFVVAWWVVLYAVVFLGPRLV